MSQHLLYKGVLLQTAVATWIVPLDGCWVPRLSLMYAQPNEFLMCERISCSLFAKALTVPPPTRWIHTVSRHKVIVLLGRLVARPLANVGRLAPAIPDGEPKRLEHAIAA